VGEVARIQTLDDALKAVAQVGPVAREYGQKAEDSRHLPVEVVDAMDDAGLWAVFAPKELGGSGLIGLGEQFEVLRALAYEDTSAAWALFICGGANALIGARLSPEGKAEVFADGVRPMAGIFQPGGSATPADGGVKVTGRWPFASGVMCSGWVMTNAIALDESGAPKPGIGGLPEIRSVVVPCEEVTLVDDWHVAGLRGTGSVTVTMQDVFVPDHRTFGFFDPVRTSEPKYHVPLFTLLGPDFTGITVGLAERMLDEVLALLPTRVGPPTFQPASADPVNQTMIGRLAAAVRGARESSRWLYREFDERVERGEKISDISMTERSAMHAHGLWVGSTCRDVVNELFQLGGANSIYEPGVLQRVWRDINVVNQHIFMRSTQYENAGKALLGVEITTPMV
jgi:alkylation response protein AidB-like acyl-CoA dehydrogenase